MEYLTESDLAEILKVSRSTLWELRKAGLPYRQVRGQIRYRLDEVNQWLDQNCTGKPLSKAGAQQGGDEDE
jgi:excisionase family DNA binding protein